MKYEVGRPHISACWVYDPTLAFMVHYYAQCSMGDGPTDCMWIVPGTISD